MRAAELRAATDAGLPYREHEFVGHLEKAPQRPLRRLKPGRKPKAHAVGVAASCIADLSPIAHCPAPFPCDSGMWRGKRRIQGGRGVVRSALYIAALTAVRHNPPLGEFYVRLLDRGKPKQIALLAVSRKLLLILNAMLLHDQAWFPDFMEA